MRFRKRLYFWGTLLLLVAVLYGWWRYQVPATMRYLGEYPCADRAFLKPLLTGFLTCDAAGLITLRHWRTGKPVWQVRASQAQRSAADTIRANHLALACSESGRYLAVLEVAERQTSIRLYRDGAFAWQAVLPPASSEVRSGFSSGLFCVYDDGTIDVSWAPKERTPCYRLDAMKVISRQPATTTLPVKSDPNWYDNTGSANDGYKASLSTLHPELGRVKSSRTGDAWTFEVPGVVNHEDAGVSHSGRFAAVYGTMYLQLPRILQTLLKPFPGVRAAIDARDTGQNQLRLYARSGRCLARLPLNYAWVWPEHDAHFWQAFPAPDGKTVVAWTSREQGNGSPTVLLLRAK